MSVGAGIYTMKHTSSTSWMKVSPALRVTLAIAVMIPPQRSRLSFALHLFPAFPARRNVSTTHKGVTLTRIRLDGGRTIPFSPGNCVAQRTGSHVTLPSFVRLHDLFGPVYSVRRMSVTDDNVKSHDNDTRRHIKVLGVCGGIGSGKSSACRILVSELGCAAHIDADSLAHSAYAPGSLASREIADEFGSVVLQESGEIDRKKLGGIVFADPDAMKKLELIVWPHVKSLVSKRIKDIKKEIVGASNIENSVVDGKNAIIVVEAAVMLDAGWEDLFDGMWVVKAPKLTTTNRLVNDRDMKSEDAAVRIDAQESRRGIGNLEEEVDRGVVTAVIENNGTFESLTKLLAKRLADPTSWKAGHAPEIVDKDCESILDSNQ